MIINTPSGATGPRADGYEIRAAAISASIPCITTVPGAGAAVQGIEAVLSSKMGVESLQRRHAALLAGKK